MRFILFGLFICNLLYNVGCSSNKIEKIEKNKNCKVALPLSYRAFSKSTKLNLDSIFQIELVAKQFSGIYCFFVNDSFYEGSLGKCNPMDTAVPNRKDVFQIASTSKPFLGIIMMQLLEEKKLKLEDKYVQYFPSFNHPEINLKHLFTHTSGLPEYHMYIQKRDSKADSLVSDNYVYNQIDTHSEKLYFKPGTEFDYCNTNFVLLARLIIKLEKKKWNEILKERIFNVIGMDSTHFYNPKNKKTTEYRVQGIYGRKNVYQEYMINAVPGDKGIYASLEDLYKFNLALYDNCLLSDSLMKLMFAPQIDYRRGTFHYGYGWRLTTVNNLHWAFHNGWWKGFRTTFWHCLDKRAGFIVLSNRAGTAEINSVTIAKLVK